MSARNFKFEAKSADKKRFMRSLHKFLNDNKWEIKLGWSERSEGLCDLENNTLYINICYSIAGTLIHEFLHARYFPVSECKIEHKVGKLEVKILKSLSGRQIRNLAIKVMLGRKITMQDFEQIPDD